jgi:leucyl aminopeptidase
MKYLFSGLAIAAAVSAVVLPHQQAIGGSQEVIENEQFLLELAPGETRWATEDEKWELRRVSTVACFYVLC